MDVAELHRRSVEGFVALVGRVPADRPVGRPDRLITGRRRRTTADLVV
ncbi:hypothetical protein [Luedemannella helvata]